MCELLEKLKKLANNLSPDKQKQINLYSQKSVYPFNVYELYFVNLLSEGILNIEEYYHLRQEHISQNKFLHVFEISAPTEFGESWAETHLKEFIPELVKPKKEYYKDYNGEYDFLFQEKIKIEVKASRATDCKVKGPLYTKALCSKSEKKFDMNFQQIKPSCCDVFVWIGVWRDLIRYWVLSSKDVRQCRYFSDKQHRGNVGEGQLHIKSDNINFFKNFEVDSSELKQKIVEAYNKQHE